MANVANRCPRRIGRMLGRASFLGLIVVNEGHHFAFKIYNTGFARREFSAIIIADMDLAEYRATDGTGFGHPFLWANDRHTVHLGTRVELEKLGPEPVHHLLFYFDGAGRSGVNDDPSTTDIVAFTHLIGQLQHSHEHGRHPLTVLDIKLFDCRKGSLGIEPFLDKSRAA